MSEPGLVPVGPGREEDAADLADETGPVPEAVQVEITPDPADGGDGADEEQRGASVSDLEALLFVAEKPLSRAELRTVGRLTADEVDERLGDLEVQLRERGIRLISSADRVMLSTAPESGQLIARYLGADSVRLSPAALETLAIIAYRQPATRGVVERIRGVDSGHVVRGLLHRRLIFEQGRAESPGRPILYGTSMEFMERFGLTSLDDLPPLEAEIAAQLAQAEVDAATEKQGGGEADASSATSAPEDAEATEQDVVGEAPPAADAADEEPSSADG